MAAHLAFSWMVFNPTDDGMFLAAARRLVDGQVPHRDFIWLYPILTSLVHAPEVALFGERLFWLSRLVVWIELALLAWVWTRVFTRVMARSPGEWERAVLALTALAISIRTFQIMTWHTVDGLLAASIGVLLRSSDSRRLHTPGVLLIGTAVLFKQSFLPGVVLLVIAFGDHRAPRRLLTALLPSMTYGAFLIVTGALKDALIQMTALSDFVGIGVRPFVSRAPVPFGVVMGVAAICLVTRGAGLWTTVARAAGATILLAPAPAIGVLLVLGRPLGEMPLMVLFGIAAGAALALRRWAPERRALAFAGLVALILAWSTAISYGENNPAFASGALCLFLLTTVRELSFSEKRAVWARCLIPVAAVVVASMATARFLHPDADRPASELRFRLDGILPGGTGIHTNATTHAYLTDLAAVVRRVNGPHAIFPDNTGVWAASVRPNAISSDWIEHLVHNENGATLMGRLLGVPRGTNPLAARVIDDIDRQRGNLAVILQKVAAGPLFVEVRPVAYCGGCTLVINHVRRTMTKVDETEYFEIYR